MSIPISQFIPPALFPSLVPIHLKRTILTVIYPGSEGPGWVSAQSRNWYMALKRKVSVAQSCLTLCNPMDFSPPGSSVHGIFKARILEWVAISFFRESSQPRDWTPVCCVFRVSCIGRKILYHWATWEAPCNWYQPLKIPRKETISTWWATVHQVAVRQDWALSLLPKSYLI